MMQYGFPKGSGDRRKWNHCAVECGNGQPCVWMKPDQGSQTTNMATHLLSVHRITMQNDTAGGLLRLPQVLPPTVTQRLKAERWSDWRTAEAHKLYTHWVVDCARPIGMGESDTRLRVFLDKVQCASDSHHHSLYTTLSRASPLTDHKWSLPAASPQHHPEVHCRACCRGQGKVHANPASAIGCWNSREHVRGHLE